VSLERMRAVRELDAVNHTMTVEAGVILADVQRAAEEHDLLFPLSLGAEGSCRIGGNLSTNAGGIAVLHYGNTRDLVLGLEVVLPDGRVWKGLHKLRKNNAGYDLKHLFMGAEGTLGIITAAVLKLFPQPRSRATALLAVADPDAASRLLAHLRSACGDTVTSFEYVPRLALEVWEAIKGEDWVLTTGDLGSWGKKLWNFDRPYCHAGRELGTGTQVGLSLGVALANKGTGRLVVVHELDDRARRRCPVVLLERRIDRPLEPRESAEEPSVDDRSVGHRRVQLRG